MLKLSKALLWLSGLVSDLNEYGDGALTWRQIRDRRISPPNAPWTPPDTSRRPFGLPPDVEG